MYLDCSTLTSAKAEQPHVGNLPHAHQPRLRMQFCDGLLSRQYTHACLLYMLLELVYHAACSHGGAGGRLQLVSAVHWDMALGYSAQGRLCSIAARPAASLFDIWHSH